MTKTKIVKGKIIYLYKGRRQLTKPDNLVIKKMLYDSDEDSTYIYLGKKTYFTEIICSVIIALLVFVKLIQDKPVVLFSYDENPVHYNDTLYLNICVECSEDIETTVSLITKNELVLDTRVLTDGDAWWTYNTLDPSDVYLLSVSYRTPYTFVHEDYLLNTNIIYYEDIINNTVED